MLYDFIVHIFTTPPAPLYLNMMLLGGFVIFFGLISLFVKERLYLTEALCATAVGIAFGPVGLGVVDLQRWAPDRYMTIMLEFSRYIIFYDFLIFIS